MLEAARKRADFPPYEGLLDFYRDVYAPAIVDERGNEQLGLTMMTSRQGAGDWSSGETPDLVLSMLISGPVRCEMDLGAGLFSKRGSNRCFVVIPPNVATAIRVFDTHELRVAAIRYERLLTLAGPEAGLSADGDFGPLHTDKQNDASIASLLDRLWIESATGTPYGALLTEGLLLQLAAELMRLRDTPLKLARGGLAPWQLKRVTERLAADLTDDVSLSELAGLVGLSTFHLCRAFAVSTGQPPHRWRVAQRIARAKKLLVGTGLPITDIAAQVGYDNPAQLSRVFRAGEGMSPSDYRRRMKS